MIEFELNYGENEGLEDSDENKDWNSLGDWMYVIDVNKTLKGEKYTERKVFLHMIKTAGISVHHGCVKAGHTLQYNQRHSHISTLPQKYQQLPRYIILRKPEDWYISFYNFFLPVEGFFSFMLRNDEGLPVDINEFIFRALNMKNFFSSHKFKTAILNSILNEQETAHFMFTFFDEQIDDISYKNYNFSIFDWFWRGTGGENAKVFPMNKKGIKELEKEFKMKMEHKNETEKHPEYVPVTKADINSEMLQLIQDVDSKYYKMFEELS